MPKETEAKEDLDFYQKLCAISEEERGDYVARVIRQIPEFDENNRYIAGYLGSIPLSEFMSGGEDLIMQRFGGNEHVIEVRGRAGTKNAGKYAARGFIKVPGRALPPSMINMQPQDSQGAPVQPGQTYTPAAPQKSEAEIRREVERDMEERQRRDEERDERRLLRQTLAELPAKISSMASGNGNGHAKQESLVDLIRALADAKDLLGAGGKSGDFSTMDLITLLDKREEKGEERAQKLIELAGKYRGDGGGEDSVIEKEMVGLIRDLIREGKLKKSGGSHKEPLDEKAIQTRTAIAIFNQFREEISDVVAEYSAMGASMLRGSKTFDELLTNIRNLLDMAMEKDDEEPGDGNADKEGEPGEPRGESRDSKPGKEDKGADTSKRTRGNKKGA